MGFKNPACVKEITNIRYGGVMSEPTIYIIVFPTYINKKRRQKIPQCYSKKCYTHVPRRLCFEVPKLHLTLGLASLNLIQVWRSHHGCRLLRFLQSYKVHRNRIKNMHLKKEIYIAEEESLSEFFTFQASHQRWPQKQHRQVWYFFSLRASQFFSVIYVGFLDLWYYLLNWQIVKKHRG